MHIPCIYPPLFKISGSPLIYITKKIDIKKKSMVFFIPQPLKHNTIRKDNTTVHKIIFTQKMCKYAPNFNRQIYGIA